jgi:hypothetical protein
MTRKRYRGRRIDATGRSVGSGHHCRFHRWEVTTPAFLSLSIGARALLLELKMLFTGNNNGDLFLSVRLAAERLHICKTTAAKLFKELQDKGFIRPKVKRLQRQGDARRRHGHHLDPHRICARQRPADEGLRSLAASASGAASSCRNSFCGPSDGTLCPIQ